MKRDKFGFINIILVMFGGVIPNLVILNKEALIWAIVCLLYTIGDYMESLIKKT